MSSGIMTSQKSALHPKSVLKNNFGLSKEQFDSLVLKLKKDDESLLTHIVENHFKSCIYYLTYNYKISESSAYDICLDTMLIFRKKILLDKISYGNLTYLFTRMAKNIYIDIQKSRNRVEDAIKQFSERDDLYKENEDLFFELLDKSVHELDSDNQKLLNDIYYSNKDIHLLAQENNISYPALRKRKQRMISKLKNILINHLKK